MKKLKKHILNFLASAYIIVISILDISDDISDIKKEHGLLIIGLFGLFNTIYELYKYVKEQRHEKESEKAIANE